MDLCGCAKKKRSGGNATQYSTWEDATQILCCFEYIIFSPFSYFPSFSPRNERKGQGLKEK